MLELPFMFHCSFRCYCYWLPALWYIQFTQMDTLLLKMRTGRSTSISILLHSNDQFSTFCFGLFVCSSCIYLFAYFWLSFGLAFYLISPIFASKWNNPGPCEIQKWVAVEMYINSPLFSLVLAHRTGENQMVHSIHRQHCPLYAIWTQNTYTAASKRHSNLWIWIPFGKQKWKK